MLITQIALIFSLALQLVAAVLAIRLTRVTKYNLSWILISAGFILMGVSRLIDMIPFFYDRLPFNTASAITWIGFVTSLCFTIGVILIRRIFNFIRKVEETRREAEKRVLKAVIQTEENERKRFAKDLHDDLGPLLSAVKLSVSSLTAMEQDDKRKEILRNTDHLITEALRSIKEISNNLSPHMLANFGLASAINDLTNRITGPGIPVIRFDSDLYGVRFNEDVEVVLYRVTGELINNTLKHAHASNVEMQLTKQGNVLILTYSDDGKGFDVPEVIHGPVKGTGISNIISRLRSVRGNLEAESSPESGSKFIIRILL